MAALLLLCGCGHRNLERPGQSYAGAVATFRNGNYQAAYQEAKSASERCAKDAACYWKCRLLEAESLFQLQKDDEAAALLSQSLPGDSDLAGLELRRRMLQGYLFSVSKDQDISAKGRQILDDTYRDVVHLDRRELLPEIEILCGSRTRDRDKARALFRDAKQHATDQGDEYNKAAALNDLGMLSLTGYRYDEAIPFLEQALEAAKRVNVRPLASAAYTNLALCYTQLGAYDRALELQKEALASLGTGDSPVVRCHLIGEMGRTLETKGDYREAIERYREALALSRSLRSDSNDDVRRWTSNLAAALASVGDWDAAAKANREEMSLAQDERAKAYANLNAANIATGRKQYDEAVAHYKTAVSFKLENPAILWASYAGFARAYAASGNKALARSYFEKAIQVIDKNQTGLRRDEYKFTFLASLIRFYQDYVEFLIESGDSNRALEIAESSRARILAENIPQQRPARSLNVSELKEAARRAGRVFLSYWLAPVQSYVWVITPARAQFFPIGPANGMQSLVDAFRQSLREWDLSAGESPAARRLADALVAPVAPLIPHGALVMIVPDGALHYLSFETLPVGEKPHYWIEDVRIAIAPSLAIAAAAPLPKPGPHRSVLILGNALASGDFPRLTYAADEIGKVESHFGGEKKVFVGPEATPAAYRQAGPQRFSVIHFSAHGEANAQSPLDSAIILSPHDGAYKLYARDVVDTPLDADLVTISACRSAGARVYSGEGLVGFAWAFLKSGAHYVVAGLWDVTDRSTPDMMDQFYGAMEKGEGPVNALREAKVAMIQSGKAMRKPYYWGPFQIYVR